MIFHSLVYIHIFYNVFFLLFEFFSFIEQENGTVKTENSEDGDDGEEGKTAALTVLLHGALKVESMVAITQLKSVPQPFELYYPILIYV